MNLFIPRIIEAPPIEVGVRGTISGKYKVEICRNGCVVRRPFGDRWISNLITNAGLDQLFAASQCNFYNATGLGGGCMRVGSSTTPPANTDTALTTGVKFCNTLNTGGGINTAFDTVNGYATHTVVWEFSAEASTVTYNELGAATTGALTGGTLYTHTLFPSGVTLNSGDNLRMTYAITASMPATITPVAVSLSAINGFNLSGNLKVIGTFQAIFGALATSGGITGGGADGGIRGVGTPRAILCTAPTVFPAVNVAPSITQVGSVVTGTPGSYTAGSFTRTTQYIFATNNPASSTSVAGLLFYDLNLGATAGAYLLFSTAQTKANTNTLTINYTTTLARA